MEQLIKQADALVADELIRAEETHGPLIHSMHEAYAVILEERDEGMAEASEADKSIDEYWNNIINKDVDKQEEALRNIEGRAILAACEYIQVAAAARKALKGYEKGRSFGGSK